MCAEYFYIFLHGCISLLIRQAKSSEYYFPVSTCHGWRNDWLAPSLEHTSRGQVAYWTSLNLCLVLLRYVLVMNNTYSQQSPSPLILHTFIACLWYLFSFLSFKHTLVSLPSDCPLSPRSFEESRIIWVGGFPLRLISLVATGLARQPQSLFLHSFQNNRLQLLL